MLQRKTTWIGVICKVVILQSLIAQPKQQVRFNNFGHIPNMPTQEIYALTQDSLGFIWIGSTDGLYKLDAANNIQIFKKNDPVIEGGIASSAIRALYVDSKNNLWIGTTAGGLTKYHQPTNEWTTFQSIPSDDTSLSNNDILSILEDSKGRIWVGTEYGLNLFQPETNSFIRFLPNVKDKQALQARAVLSILEDHQQRIWISNWGGGIHLFLPNEEGDISKSTFRQFYPTADKATHNVWTIYQDKSLRYWLATIGGGLFLMDLPEAATNVPTKQDWTPTFTNFRHEEEDTNSLSSNLVHSVIEDKRGYLWIATINGLNRIITQDLIDPLGPKEIERFYPDINNQRNINSEKNHLLYEDQQGLLWFGTANGISQYSWYTNQFENYLLYDPLKGKNIITDIQSHQQHIWIGTNKQGLLAFDIENGTFVSHHFGFLNSSISNLYLSKDKELWVGTSKGIQKINPITLSYETFPIPDKLLRKHSHVKVTNLLKDSKGYIWIGNLGSLLRLDEQTGEYTAYYHDPNNPSTIGDASIYDIHEDSRGYLWISGYKGLNRVNMDQPGKVFFKRYYQDGTLSSLPSDRVRAITEVDGQLFFGSRHGLFQYDYESDQFIDLNEKEDRYLISSLEKSPDGRLWGCTSNSIFHYNIEEKTFHFYDSYNELGGAVFRANESSTKDDHGCIYFAGPTGFVRFNPSAITKNTQKVPLVITSSKTISPKRTNLSSDTYSPSIQLNHNDYHLTIDFALQNFINSRKNQYSYMLEGFDKTWNDAVTNQSATYTNLPHGDYTFKVKAANNDGIWKEETLEVALEKVPAFWETNWFKIGLSLLALLVGVLGVSIYTRNVRNKNRNLSKFNESLNKEIIERKKVEAELQKREQSMDQLIKELKRSNYDLEQFAYIASHDLQAPLRTIESFGQLLEKSLSGKLNSREQDFLNFISSGVGNMQELVGSLLTFSRVNTKSENLISINLSKLINLIQLEINSLLQEREAQIIVQSLPETIVGDKIKIKQLFQNLIVNAIKFTKPDIAPIVRIQYAETPTHWEFKVIDNGIGIEPEFQAKVFQLFQRLHTKDKYEGTGIGLALCKKIVEQHKGKISIESELGKGSCFTFTIDKRLKVKEEKEEFAVFS